MREQKGTIALVAGGLGAEKEVSRATGKAFAAALDDLGLKYKWVEADHELPRTLMDLKPSVALLALHGKYAEDGTVQGLCEYLRIPYSGSGVLASAVCMDKYVTKQILSFHKIPTPRFQFVDLSRTKLESVLRPKLFPVVIKPSREGSSVGVRICRSAETFYDDLKFSGQSDHHVLIEEFIDGMELTVAVLGERAMTPIEISPTGEFYDYERKYTKGQTNYFLPARLPEPLLQQSKEMALRVHEACHARAYSRVDFRLSRQNELFVIEINTLPGCTPTSLLPKAAAHEGMKFSDVVRFLIETATLDYGSGSC